MSCRSKHYWEQTEKEKQAARLKTRAWRAAHPQRAKEIDKATYLKHRVKKIAYATAYTKQWRRENAAWVSLRDRAKAHGITPEQLIDLYRIQKHQCAICGAKETSRKFHIDHNHTTHKIRGLICSAHNLAIRYDVTPAILRATADYLEHDGIEYGTPIFDHPPLRGSRRTSFLSPEPAPL